MKTAIFAFLLLTGCAAGPPLTFDQRMQLIHAMQQQPRYVLPPPAPLAPVNRQITCYTSGNVTTCQ